MRNRKADIEKYLRGKLSPAEMHALEKEALGDPFLAEALEGVEQAGADNFLYDLHRINRSVHQRSRRRSIKNNNTIRMWGWTSAIAATVLLVAVSGFLVINILRDQAAEKQAMNELAILQAGDDKKDTVLIPLPRETFAYQAEGPQKEDAPFSAGIAANETVSPQRAANERSKVADEGVKTPDVADSLTQDVLALNEVRSEEEREREAKQESAEQRENPSIEKAQTKSAVATGDDKATRAAKRTERRAAGAEAKAQAPALSGAVRSDAIPLRGKVVSADGHALPGVNVIIDGTSTGTVTDAEGHFELVVPEDTARIHFAFIGYESDTVEVKGRNEINVQLREDITTLSEVVVTGYGSDGGSVEERGTFNFAEPRGGRADFKNYLSNAVQYPVEALRNKTEGRVTVRFTVDTNGSLSDFEVLKGIGHGCEEELIRAIKEGPSWTPSKQAERPLRDQVKVRFKFQLPD